MSSQQLATSIKLMNITQTAGNKVHSGKRVEQFAVKMFLCPLYERISFSKYHFQETTELSCVVFINHEKLVVINHEIRNST